MAPQFREKTHVVSLSIATLVVIAIGVVTYLDWAEYDKAASSAEHSRAIIEHTEEILSALKDAETGQRGYLLSGDPRYLAPYEAALPELDRHLRELAGSTVFADLALAHRLQALVAEKLEEFRLTIELRRRGDMDGAIAIVRTNRGKRTMDEISEVANRIANTQRSQFAARTLFARQHANRTRFVVLAGTGLLAALLLGATVHISRLLRSQNKLMTDLERSHQEEERSKTAFETTLRSIGDALIATDAHGQIQFMNPVAEQLTGWQAVAATGIQLTEVFHVLNELTRAPVEDPVTRVLREGTVVGLANHAVLLTKDGREIPIDDSGAPIRDRQGALTGVVLIFRDVSAKRQAQRDLEDSERRYRLLFEHNPQPMWVYDTGTLAFLDVNNSAVQHYGYSREEFLGMTLQDIRPVEDIPKLLEDTRIRSTVRHTDGPWRHRKKNGSVIQVEITAHPMDFRGREARFIMVNDITSRAHLEEQLRQSQKLEAVGRLAGGVAHDFNNLLTVISGYADMIRDGQTDPGSYEGAIQEIASAAQRASALTQQLLAFSRRQMLQPRMLSLNTSVCQIEKMLARLLGEDIQVVTRLAPELWDVSADPGQVDQILMNLAVNARDAMEHGGTLTIETKNANLRGDEAAAHAGVEPGDYARLVLSDTGHGMDAETKARIFEPFFTTKEQGRGTGLGLSTVYGIVKQSGGSIRVDSTLGKGTQVEIYLPRFAGQPSPVQEPPRRKKPGRGGESILVVEDDPIVRKLICTMLSRSGYSAVSAASAEEAMRICRQSDRLDLLISDLVLPEADGREIARQVQALRPGLPVVFMSGYTEHAVLRQATFDAGTHFLQKPFTQELLANTVRSILDASS